MPSRQPTLSPLSSFASKPIVRSSCTEHFVMQTSVTNCYGNGTPTPCICDCSALPFLFIAHAEPRALRHTTDVPSFQIG